MNGLNSLKNGNNMGYYTYFSLRMIGDEKAIQEVIKAASELKDIDESDTFKDGVKELVTTGCIDAKWYRFEEDFIPFAKQYPNVLFIVDGSGEEEMDVWQLRIKGDKTEYHEVIMPRFTTPELLTKDEKHNN